MRITSFNIHIPPLPTYTWSAKIRSIDLVAIKNTALQKGCQLGWKGPVAIIGLITVIIGMRLFSRLFAYPAIPPSPGFSALDTQHSQKPIITQHRRLKKIIFFSSLKSTLLNAQNLFKEALEKSAQARKETEQAYMNYIQATQHEKKTCEERLLMGNLFLQTLAKNKRDYSNPDRMEKHSNLKRAREEHDTATQALSIAHIRLSSALNRKKTTHLTAVKRKEELRLVEQKLDQRKQLQASYQREKTKILNTSFKGNRGHLHQRLMKLRRVRQMLSNLSSYKGSPNSSRTFNTSLY